MWYFRKVESLCEQFGRVSTCLYPKYIKFWKQNLRNGREYENGRRQTNCCFDNGKQISIIFCEIEIFFIFKTKCSLSTVVDNFNSF